jgi:hypothetical protein
VVKKTMNDYTYDEHMPHAAERTTYIRNLLNNVDLNLNNRRGRFNYALTFSHTAFSSKTNIYNTEYNVKIYAS